MRSEAGIPLSRLTTIGTGGPARRLARPRTLAELEQALHEAADQGLDVVVVGLGSNVLAADEGVDALVLRLEGELAEVEVRDGGLSAGGGATNAVCLHRARAAALGGFEFASAIPGTLGGGVRMNAGAYGRDWAQIVRRVRSIVERVRADQNAERTKTTIVLSRVVDRSDLGDATVAVDSAGNRLLA